MNPRSPAPKAGALILTGQRAHMYDVSVVIKTFYVSDCEVVFWHLCVRVSVEIALVTLTCEGRSQCGIFIIFWISFDVVFEFFPVLWVRLPILGGFLRLRFRRLLWLLGG